MGNENEQAVEELKFVSMAELLADDSEFEGYNPEADANAGLPPLPKGDYLCIVRYSEPDPAKRWPGGKDKEGNPTGKMPVTKDGRKYAYTEIEIETNGNAEPTHNGRIFRGMVNTLVMKASGTTSIQGLLQGCGAEVEELRAANSISGQVQTLDKYLSDGQTIAGVHLDWESNYYRKDLMNPETGKMGWEVFRVRGMRKFPQKKDGDGQPIPGEYVPGYPFKQVVAGNPVDEELNARNFIHHWVRVDEIAGAGVEGDPGEQVQAQAEAPKAEAPAPAAQRRTVAPAAAAPAKAATAASAGGPPVPARARR